MTKNKVKKRVDSFVERIERTFNFGKFVSYEYTYDFMSELNDLRKEIEDIAFKSPQQAVNLFEIFLHGCTEKIEEMDDSNGDMGMLFGDLFCSWVEARQKAGCTPEETLDLIERWKEKDNYGFFYDLDKELVFVFNRQTLDLLKRATLEAIDKEMKPLRRKKSPLPYSIRSKIELIKHIYTRQGDLKSYIEFIQKNGMTPKDCEEVSKIFQRKRKYSEALDWVEKGLKIESKGEEASISSYGLTNLKKELLRNLGNKNEALDVAWMEFKDYPSSDAYSDFMKYVPRDQKKSWHKKVIDFIKNGPLEPVIDICVKTKEYDVLVDRILKCKYESLEELSHYSTEGVAKMLERISPEAAAKVYRAQGVRIVKSKKSKYYDISWDHFEQAKKLYLKAGQEKEWSKLVRKIIKDHSRKSNFIDGFRKVVAGTKEKESSLAQRAEKRWN